MEVTFACKPAQVGNCEGFQMPAVTNNSTRTAAGI
jgi:hypothetical protein